MSIWFENVKVAEKLARQSEVGDWHVKHGWAYNVYEVEDIRCKELGMFYVTHFAGLGVIVHFDTVVNHIEPMSILLAFRKGIRIVKQEYDTIFATIPRSKEKLISVALRLGFAVVPLVQQIVSNGDEYCLLQYLASADSIL